QRGYDVAGSVRRARGGRGVCARRRKTGQPQLSENRKASLRRRCDPVLDLRSGAGTEGPQVRTTRPGHRGLRLAERRVAKCRLAFGFGVLRKAGVTSRRTARAWSPAPGPWDASATRTVRAGAPATSACRMTWAAP